MQCCSDYFFFFPYIIFKWVKDLSADGALAESNVSSLQPKIWAISSSQDGLLPGVMQSLWFNEDNTKKVDFPS